MARLKYICRSFDEILDGMEEGKSRMSVLRKENHDYTAART